MSSRKFAYQFFVRRKRVSAMEEVGQYAADSIATPLGVAVTVRNILRASDDFREHFIVLYLDTAKRIIGYEVAAWGAEHEVHVEPRLVFRGALLAGADALIIAHNHPSGLCRPSAADDSITTLMKAAGEIVRIPVVDHVIVTETGLYSYAFEKRIF